MISGKDERDALKTGNMTIASSGGEGSWQEYWYRGGWQDGVEMFWEDFKRPGGFSNRHYETPSVPLQKAPDTADLAEMPDAEADEEPDVSWMQQLKISESGKIERTANNVLLMLSQDPRMKERIQYNEFNKRIEGVGPLPWAGREEAEVFAAVSGKPS